MSRKKKTKKIKDVERFIDSLVACFEDAYRKHVRGATETELLIELDIFAADYHARHPEEPEQCMMQAHRGSLKSGIEAADAGVPLSLAASILRVHLEKSAEEIVRQCDN
jgi:hypothetical protein